MFVRADMLRRPQENKAWMITGPARRKRLVKHAGHFVLLSVGGVVNHLVNAGMGNLLPRLEYISDFSHAAIVLLGPWFVQENAATRN